jgi:hypothetical protein
MAKGNIGVTSDNIFPVIKKFLYSDHEIFLRELVSNAVDATQKLKTLSSVGNCKRTFLLIYRNAHSQVAQFTFKIANRSQYFQFLSCKN